MYVRFSAFIPRGFWESAFNFICIFRYFLDIGYTREQWKSADCSGKVGAGAFLITHHTHT
jgi:hypothetical protein